MNPLTSHHTCEINYWSDNQMEEGTTTTMSATQTLLTSVSTGMSTEITAALPIAGGVFATVAGIFIAVRIFKRITGAKA